MTQAIPSYRHREICEKFVVEMISSSIQPIYPRELKEKFKEKFKGIHFSMNKTSITKLVIELNLGTVEEFYDHKKGRESFVILPIGLVEE